MNDKSFSINYRIDGQTASGTDGTPFFSAKASSGLSRAFFKKGILPVILSFFLLTVCGCLLTNHAHAAATPLSQLEKKLEQERKRADERKRTLARLTEEERKLNAALAKAEKRILELEKGIVEHQGKLLELGNADDTARQEYERLITEQKKTEQAQTDTLRLLWEIAGKRIAVGSRELADWAETDREYAWSQGLYASLEVYRKQLDEQEAKLMQVVGRRTKLSRDMERRLQAVNDEKGKLLKARIDYDRQLDSLRQKRTTTEAELENVLKLVANLNFEISQRTAKDIKAQKGKLPWPVTGKVRVRYAPGANPPSRGLGFSTSKGAEVRSVAYGTVVHNDVLRGFGTVLIVKHGDDYYSLYAFLSNSPLKVGQEVASRQPIGTAGIYPAVNGSGLYFELRLKQKAINPEVWFALK